MEKEAYNIAMEYGRELFEQSGEQGYIGRAFKDSKGIERYYSSADAFNRFCHRLWKCLEMEAVKEGEKNE